MFDRLGRAGLAAPLLIVLAALAAPQSAAAQPEEEPQTEPRSGRRPGNPRIRPNARVAGSGLRDPQGTLLLGVNGGYGVGGGTQFGSIGVHAGYAFITGVVPGVRADYFFGDVSGGQVIGTLWLTPPLRLAVVPFAVGEIGYVWQDQGSVSTSGVLYGAGGGLHLGRPGDRISVRAGAIYRVFGEGGDGFFSPLVVASFRFY